MKRHMPGLQTGVAIQRPRGCSSMNPFRHVDPFGTVLVPIVVAVLSGFHFVFGWAKPVPINWYQLRKPRRDMKFPSRLPAPLPISSWR